MPLESQTTMFYLSILATRDGNFETGVAIARYLHPLHGGSHFGPAPLDELRIPVVGGGHAILVKVFQQDLALLIREHHSSCLCIRLRRDVCVGGQRVSVSIN